MQVYAYRLILKLAGQTDSKSTEFQQKLEDNHQKMVSKMEQFGNDPLPKQPLTTSFNEEGKEVIVTWRSFIGPHRQDLLDAIKEYTYNWGPIEGFELYSHRCGSGAGKSCGPWQKILTGGNS